MDDLERIFLPPIMATPGLRLVDVGVTTTGRNYMKFATIGRSANPVREVVVYVSTASDFLYEYSRWDPSDRLIKTYRGTYGDPERDELVNFHGGPELPR